MELTVYLLCVLAALRLDTSHGAVPFIIEVCILLVASISMWLGGGR